MNCFKKLIGVLLIICVLFSVGISSYIAESAQSIDIVFVNDFSSFEPWNNVYVFYSFDGKIFESKEMNKLSDTTDEWIVSLNEGITKLCFGNGGEYNNPKNQYTEEIDYKAKCKYIPDEQINAYFWSLKNMNCDNTEEPTTSSTPTGESQDSQGEDKSNEPEPTVTPGDNTNPPANPSEDSQGEDKTTEPDPTVTPVDNTNPPTNPSEDPQEDEKTESYVMYNKSKSKKFNSKNNTYSINYNDKYTLKICLKAEKGDDVSLNANPFEYTVSDKKGIIKVSKTGKITTKKCGISTINVSCKDTNYNISNKNKILKIKVKVFPKKPIKKYTKGKKKAFGYVYKRFTIKKQPNCKYTAKISYFNGKKYIKLETRKYKEKTKYFEIGFQKGYKYKVEVQAICLSNKSLKSAVYKKVLKV
ncbi:MAG: hypothetical protein VZQ55_05915 [Ruminococcus sp.]|nr:hypothetical protein [Ruminococcus sp.]